MHYNYQCAYGQNVISKIIPKFKNIILLNHCTEFLLCSPSIGNYKALFYLIVSYKTWLTDSNTSTQGKILSQPVENFYFKISTTNTTL
jgi:hypothetical protein